jgi:hypothetical protein
MISQIGMFRIYIQVQEWTGDKFENVFSVEELRRTWRQCRSAVEAQLDDYGSFLEDLDAIGGRL